MDRLWFFMTLTLDVIPFMILLLYLLKSKLPCSMFVTAMKLILPIVAYNAFICVTYMNDEFVRTSLSPISIVLGI